MNNLRLNLCTENLRTFVVTQTLDKSANITIPCLKATLSDTFETVTEKMKQILI